MERIAAGDASGSVAWLPWNPAAFARARAERAPVLLHIGAAWCPCSAEMSRTTYRDPAVCRLVERAFVPVRVDADRRPDINERYNLGGWPTTVFLTPAGQLLGGETYVDAARMTALLERVAEAFAQRHDEVNAPRTPPPAERAPEPPDSGRDLDRWLEQHLLERFDPQHGGFGTAPKHVHAAAVRFALRRSGAAAGPLREVASRTLDAIGWSGLYDDVDGGVFRYCAARDWTAPHVEKLLAVNASVLDLLLEGCLVLGEPQYRERAAHLIRYVLDTLADRAAGGFFASQYADDGYYAAPAAERGRLAGPPVDRSVYAAGTARMAAALLRAAEVFGDSSLLEFAVTSLERVAGDTYERGGGVAHAVGDGEIARGLLADQVAVSDTLLDLYGATERDVYLDLAQELMRFCFRALWDTGRGGFVDRVVAADDVGLLREPLRPFAVNCAAVRVLARLSRLTGQDDFRERAAATLASLLPGARQRGVDAAPWALAALELQD